MTSEDDPTTHTPLINDGSNKLAKDRLTRWVAFATLVAVIGGTFQFGFHTGVLGSPADAIEKSFSGCNTTITNCNSTVTTVQWSLAVSIFAIGGCVGGLGSAPLVAYLGLRWVFALNNLVFIAASLIMAFSTNVHIFTLGRFFVGVGSGVTTAITGKYLADIAPISLRGGISIVSQLGCTTGILIAQVMGLEKAWGTLKSWPFLLGFSVVPAVLQLVALPLMPESPRWLYLTKKDSDAARKSLRRLRDHDASIVDRDIAEMEEEKRSNAAVSTLSVADILRSPALRYVLLIGVMLQACQQLSGINSIFYFSNSIFSAAHVKEDTATVIAGSINVLMTVVSVFLIDRLGRRVLMLWGLGGMCISYALLTVSFNTQDHVSGMSYVSVVAVILVIIFFAVGPGGIAWLMVAEIFSTAASPAGISVCVGCNWMFNFIVGISFPSLQKALHENTFVPFIAITLIAFCGVYFLVPETKGKTIEQIEAAFASKDARGKRQASAPAYQLMRGDTTDNDDGSNSAV